MKAIYTFSFILGLTLSLEAFASPDMTHESGVGSTEGFIHEETGFEERESVNW